MKYIFRVTIKPGYSAELYAEAWVKASELIQQSEGARGTQLHRMIDNPDQLLAIASWDSKAARDAMEADRGKAVKDIVRSQAAYVDIELIGEFEEPEWEVLPGQY